MRFGLPEYNARLLTASRETADYFEAALDSKPNVTPDFARAVSNWIIGEIGRLSNQTGIGMSDMKGQAGPGHHSTEDGGRRRA